MIKDCLEIIQIIKFLIVQGSEHRRHEISYMLITWGAKGRSHLEAGAATQVHPANPGHDVTKSKEETCWRVM